MKTLSANNQTNIAATFQNPDILVEMTGISKLWSSKTRGGYETRIVGISSIQQAVDPLGGVAEQADFTITIQQETPTQFIQDLEADNESVDVYLRYGADDKITLIKGRLDRWEFAAGLLHLHCISNLQLPGKHLPIEQITADNFSSFAIPTEHIGRWIPVTIGTHDRALGYLIDKTVAAQKIKFNAAITGHAAVGAYTEAYVWISGGKEFLDILTTLLANGSGHLDFDDDTSTSMEIGFVELTLKTIPVAVTGDADWVDQPYAIDDDFTTNAYAHTFAPLNDTKRAHLRARIRDFPFPEGIVVLEDRLYFLCDIQRTIGGVLTGAEVCEVGIEREAGTFPATSHDVIELGDDDFDNLNDLDDGVTDIVWDVSALAAFIGIDLDGDDTKETLPVQRLGNRNLTIRYTEEQDDEEEPKIMRLREMRLWIDMRAEALTQVYYGNLVGYDDDGGGTYTGAANAAIENPADVIHFILAELLGLTGITTADFTTARSDLGNYVIAGQVLQRQDAKHVLDTIARQGKLKLFIDYDDQWSVSAYAIPDTADRELVQADGDFVTEDGLMEGEIASVTQTPLDQLYNQFEIHYAWNEGTRAFDQVLTLDESTDGLIGDWLTESQGRYNTTRKLSIDADWVRTAESALSYGTYLIYMLADRKRVVHWQTGFNCADLEIGDRIRLTHVDVQVCEDTTVHAGYRAGGPLATIKAGYVDPDTSATIKAGAKVELNEGRHQYEINAIETIPLEGKIRFQGRQVDFSRSPLSEPF